MHALKNCTIYTGDKILENKAVLIRDGRIKDIVAIEALPTDISALNLNGHTLAPGFMDLQLNGCGGKLFNDDISEKTLDVMTEATLSSGCTTYLPTLVSCSDEDMRQAMQVVATYRQKKPDTVLGLHIEGPYLSFQRRGIHNPDMIRLPDTEMLELMVQYGPDVVRMTTMAPEAVLPEHINVLTRAGIRVSAGHSAARTRQAKNAFTAGVSMATHLFNGMAPLKGRAPGLVGTVFLESPWTGIIVDGIHVHWDNVRLAKRLLDKKLFCITDATPAVGTNITKFEFGGQQVYIKQGKCAAADGTIGGSILTMNRAVYNCVHHVGIALDEALRMATLYPARALGMDHEYGKIAPGYWADMVVLNDEQTVHNVFKRGQSVFTNPETIHRGKTKSAQQPTNI